MSDMSRFSISWHILTHMLHTYVVNCCNMPCESLCLDDRMGSHGSHGSVEVAPSCRGAEPSREGQSCTGASPKYVLRRSSHAQYNDSTLLNNYWIISLHFSTFLSLSSLHLCLHDTLDTLDTLETLVPSKPMLPDVTGPNLYHIDDINHITSITSDVAGWFQQLSQCQ